MTQDVSSAQLRIIRFALFGGIILFGGVAAFVANGNPGGIAMNANGPLVGIVALLVLAAAGVVMVVRRKLESVLTVTKRAPLLIIGHGACEAAALLGGVHILLTGGIMPYVAGVAVFVFSLVLLPIEHA
jgi:hypothetical protein